VVTGGGVDTGHTEARARYPRDAASAAEVCALPDKPSRREVSVKAKWVGFEIPDTFVVVGYGIDYAQRNRNLPHIGSVWFV
jgi:hypoxanthine phosphoribosyltransferase